MTKLYILQPGSLPEPSRPAGRPPAAGSGSPLPRRRAPFTLAALAAILSVACGSTVDGPDGPSVANPLDVHEKTAFDTVNEIRAAAGLTPVTECASLNVSASKHSDAMRDKGYLDDEDPDGSTPKTRACAAGYVTACGATAMAELVAAGNGDGKLTVDQWKADATTGPLMVDPQFNVAGIGRALFGDRPIWTLDLAPVNEPSCAP